MPAFFAALSRSVARSSAFEQLLGAERHEVEARPERVLGIRLRVGARRELVGLGRADGADQVLDVVVVRARSPRRSGRGARASSAC